jgi:hypothetical protein
VETIISMTARVAAWQTRRGELLGRARSLGIQNWEVADEVPDLRQDFIAAALDDVAGRRKYMPGSFEGLDSMYISHPLHDAAYRQQCIEDTSEAKSKAEAEDEKRRKLIGSSTWAPG